MQESPFDRVRKTLKKGLDQPLTSDQNFNRVVFNQVYLGVYMVILNRVDFPPCFKWITKWHVNVAIESGLVCHNIVRYIYLCIGNFL